MEFEFRPSQPSDAEIAVPLIYSSGPKPLEYGFSLGKHTAQEFIACAFSQGTGLFSWSNHPVAMLNNEIVGISTFFSANEYRRRILELTVQVIRFCPQAFPRWAYRGLHLQAICPAPSRNALYITHGGVRADAQSRGIATAWIRHLRTVAVQQGKQILSLDVSANNPRAQALYEKLGFVVTRLQKFPGPAGLVDDYRRMELKLDGR